MHWLHQSARQTDHKAHALHAERWLKPGTELAKKRPMPEDWYSGWDAQAPNGELPVAADEAGAPGHAAIEWTRLRDRPAGLSACITSLVCLLGHGICLDGKGKAKKADP